MDVLTVDLGLIVTEVLRPNMLALVDLEDLTLTTAGDLAGRECWCSIFIFFRSTAGVFIDFSRASRRAAVSIGFSNGSSARGGAVG